MAKKAENTTSVDSAADSDEKEKVETTGASTPTDERKPSAKVGKKRRKRRKPKRSPTAVSVDADAILKSKSTPKESDAEKESKRVPRPYPQRTLQEALAIPEVIKDKNKGNPFATTDVADACGYKNVRSGSFFYLSVAARDYGLTVGTYNTEKIELSPLGRRIVIPNTPEDERKAKIEAFFNIDVFKKVYNHFGGAKFPPEKQEVLSKYSSE